MTKKNPTSFVLSNSIQNIKDELAPIYGLKNILSAGLLLLSRLSDTEQKKIIAEVNNADFETLEQKPQTLRDFFKNIAKKAKEKPECQIELPRTIIHITPADKESNWFKALGLELSEKKGKAKGG